MARFAIIDPNNKVALLVAADSIDGTKSIFPNSKIVFLTPDNPASVGDMYDEETEKFILADEIETVETPIVQKEEVEPKVVK